MDSTFQLLVVTSLGLNLITLALCMENIRQIKLLFKLFEIHDKTIRRL